MGKWWKWEVQQSWLSLESVDRDSWKLCARKANEYDVWNATITDRRPTHGTMRKGHRTQTDNNSIIKVKQPALFSSARWSLRTTPQNKDTHTKNTCNGSNNKKAMNKQQLKSRLSSLATLHHKVAFCDSSMSFMDAFRKIYYGHNVTRWQITTCDSTFFTKKCSI